MCSLWIDRRKRTFTHKVCHYVCERTKVFVHLWSVDTGDVEMIARTKLKRDVDFGAGWQRGELSQMRQSMTELL